MCGPHYPPGFDPASAQGRTTPSFRRGISQAKGPLYRIGLPGMTPTRASPSQAGRWDQQTIPLEHKPWWRRM